LRNYNELNAAMDLVIFFIISKTLFFRGRSHFPLFHTF
jgi:hypothetical protein